MAEGNGSGCTIMFEISSRTAYSNSGQLHSFSLDFAEYYHSYYDPPEEDLGNDYYFRYYIESVAENITKPNFIQTAETPYPHYFEQIIFYGILTYSVIKNKRKRRNDNDTHKKCTK